MASLGSADVPILILDDDPMVLRAWQRCAKHTGLKVATYSSAGDALEHLAHRSVLACITDWDLGERTSLGFLQMLASRKPELPTYVVTGAPDRASLALDSAGLHVPVLPKSQGVRAVLESVLGRAVTFDVA